MLEWSLSLGELHYRMVLSFGPSEKGSLLWSHFCEVVDI